MPVLLTGDFNSRINKLNECVTFDYEFFHELQFDEAIADILSDEESLERLDIPVVRKTEDNVCNNYGRRFIEFRKMSTLYIFNGRVGSDRSIGSYTTSRNSVVDYTIGLPSILSKCVNFEVLDFDPFFLTYTVHYNLVLNQIILIHVPYLNLMFPLMLMNQPFIMINWVIFGIIPRK